MRIPAISDYCNKRKARRLRSIMRGYEILRKQDRLDFILNLKDQITNCPLNLSKDKISSIVFGAGTSNAELILKQFLITRIVDLNFNSTILFSISNPTHKIAFPLPVIWINILKENNLNVSKTKCLILFYFFCLKMIVNGIVYGCILSINSLLKINAKNISNNTNGIVYFDSLTISNLSPHKESHNIINWYLQWKNKINNLKYIHHSVSDAKEYSIDNVIIGFSSRTIVLFSSLKSLIKYLALLFLATIISLYNLSRCRWWNAVIFYETAKSLAMKVQNPNFIANQYMFHNSGWLYRPLWTYEAELKGAEIIFYFYSTNCETFQSLNKKFIQANSWQLINWPKYLVWDNFQAVFIRKFDANSPDVEVVGAIWFSSSGETLKSFSKKSIAVFDVQPFRSSRYQILGLDIEYYTPKNANKFVSDIFEVCCNYNLNVLFKRKREIGNAAHPNYRNHLKKFLMNSNFVSIEPDISPTEIIEKCSGVVSMPFTSTALVAKQLGIPSIYYDPFGMVLHDDPASHSISVITNKDELYKWIESLEFS